jgi:transposase InsO family protein
VIKTTKRSLTGETGTQRVVTEFVTYYNHERLHSTIGHITPKDKLEGRAETIQAARDAKLAAAREARKAQRQAS